MPQTAVTGHLKTNQLPLSAEIDIYLPQMPYYMAAAKNSHILSFSPASRGRNGLKQTEITG